MANIPIETSIKPNGAASEFKNKIYSAEEKLGNLSSQAGKKIGAMASDLAEQTSEYVQIGRNYIEENPVKSLLMAAAVGLGAGILGTLTLRRRR
jgi:ElaB/YqjD/DUF883 family membrane-anchored ribosome-binding protein